METVIVVLASAGTAAFVAGMITLVGQHLDRQARRRELLLAKAVQIASIRVEHLMKTANNNQQTAVIPDLHYLTERYYQSFAYLMDHGKLPPEEVARYEDAFARLHAKDDTPR